jgi:hypothetical protein
MFKSNSTDGLHLKPEGSCTPPPFVTKPVWRPSAHKIQAGAAAGLAVEHEIMTSQKPAFDPISLMPLDLTGAKDLGLAVSRRTGVIRDVSPFGLIADWNRDNPHSEVGVGDKILELWMDGKVSKDLPCIIAGLHTKGLIQLKIISPDGHLKHLGVSKGWDVHDNDNMAEAGAETSHDSPGLMRMRIAIVEAHGLQSLDGNSDPDVFCTCMVPGDDRAHFSTHLMAGLEPVWNAAYTIERFAPGSKLRFTVFERIRGQQRVIGIGLINWDAVDQAYRNDGYDAYDVELADIAAKYRVGTLRVMVSVIDSEAEHRGSTHIGAVRATKVDAAGHWRTDGSQPAHGAANAVGAQTRLRKTKGPSKERMLPPSRKITKKAPSKERHLFASRKTTTPTARLPCHANVN